MRAMCHRCLRADVNGSNNPSLGSLLVLELVATGRASGFQQQKLCTSYPSWYVISLHSSSFTAVPSPVSEGYGEMVLNKTYG